MSNNEESSNEEQPREQGWAAVYKYAQEHKIEIALWITRIITLFYGISYFFPIFSAPENSYSKVLLSNAATSALRLHQRTQSVTERLTREFLIRVLAEDSFHYLLYSLNFMPCAPITLVLVPILLFALLHFASYTLILCDVSGRNNALSPRFIISIVEYHQRNILRGAAFVEIFLMPLTVLNLFLGRVNLVTPIMFYQFLKMRYQSTRNPYTRTMFYELRISTERLCTKSYVPAFVRTLLHSLIQRISMLAPPVQQ